MNMLNQLRQPAKRFDRILPETDRVGRSKSYAFKTLNFVDSLQQLHKRAFAVNFCKFVAPVQVDDLTEQSDFLYAAPRQRAHLVNNLPNRSAPFMAARGWNDTESAVHVAALHDRYERGDLPRSEK